MKSTTAISLILGFLIFVFLGILAITHRFEPRMHMPPTVAEGEGPYVAYCASCHKEHGRGISGIVPPLANSDYLYNHSTDHIIRLLLYGYKGKMVVNNVEYTGEHQPFGKLLSDSLLSSIVTYIYNAWSNIGPSISAHEVAKIRSEGKSISEEEVLNPTENFDVSRIPKSFLVEYGKRVYSWYCRSCHGVNGEGHPGIHPPLRNSDYLREQPIDTILHNIIWGLRKPIVVNGITYNGNQMPPLSPNVSDIAVSAILTYVFSEMTPRNVDIPLSQIQRIRRSQQ